MRHTRLCWHSPPGDTCSSLVLLRQVGTSLQLHFVTTPESGHIAHYSPGHPPGHCPYQGTALPCQSLPHNVSCSSVDINTLSLPCHLQLPASTLLPTSPLPSPWPCLPIIQVSADRSPPQRCPKQIAPSLPTPVIPEWLLWLLLSPLQCNCLRIGS